MTPEQVEARLAGLREAGATLRRRPAREIVEALGELLEGWRDPASAWRRELEADLPQATGFRAETVREGLARGLAPWTADALRELVKRELPDAGARGFDATAVLLAGAIPMPSLLSLIAPLVLRSPVLAKPAARDPLTAQLVARSLAEIDPELGRCLAVVDFPGSDAACLDAFLCADCVVATGSDETVDEVAARVRAPRRCIPYGHRLSVAALGDAATRGPALEAVAGRAALDVVLWDQLGCLSPLALYVVGGDPGAPDRVADALGQALADAAGRWPRGEVPASAAAAIAQERADAELRAAAGRSVRVLRGEGTSWTVVREDGCEPRAAPLHRFVRVVPVADASALLGALGPLSAHLAAVGIAGFGAGSAPLAEALTDLGASRVCGLGEMQSPPLGWPRDGRGVLAPLARLAAVDPTAL